MSATHTSRTAYRDIRDQLGRRQQQVLQVIERHPEGITNLEICYELGWPINTITPRVVELRTAGLVGLKEERPCKITKKLSKAWARVKGVQADLFATISQAEDS